MNLKTIRKSRWFWAWQDEEEEAWLRQMSKQGYHLVNPGLLGRYTFIQGEQQDMVYRLDFITSKMKNEEYFQLFQDAGWEHVGELSSWQYWRKPMTEGQKLPEIFSDNESKAKKYKRVLFLTFFFMPILTISTMDLVKADGVFYNTMAIFSATLLAIYIYMVIRILQRIRQLRQV